MTYVTLDIFTKMCRYGKIEHGYEYRELYRRKIVPTNLIPIDPVKYYKKPSQRDWVRPKIIKIFRQMYGRQYDSKSNDDRLLYTKIYRNIPKNKERQASYTKKWREGKSGCQQPQEQIIKKKEYHSRPENKAKANAYRQRPEVKARKNESRRTPDYRAEKRANYCGRTPEYKAKTRAYKQRPEVKARDKVYRQRPEYKARTKAYQARPEVKKRNHENYLRLKALQTPEDKARELVKRREINAMPKVKKRNHDNYIKRSQTSEYKARMYKMHRTPEYRAKQRAYYQRQKK